MNIIILLIIIIVQLVDEQLKNHQLKYCIIIKQQLANLMEIQIISQNWSVELGRFVWNTPKEVYS